MKLSEFKKIKINDLVFVVINSGISGISKYQYLGVFTDHETNERKHLFISPYFVSTITVLEGRENFSINLQRIFKTETQAKKFHSTLLD